MKYIIWAIVCAMILWYSFYSVQVNKQESIERQVKMEMDQKQSELDYKKEQEESKQIEKNINENLLNACLEDAQTDYLEYAELNWTLNDDWSVWATDYIWGKAQKIKDNSIDICFKKYGKLQ